MPIQNCSLGGSKSGYRWGQHGHCYATREQALKQMRAIFHSGYTGAEASFDEILSDIENDRVQSLSFAKSHFTLESAKAWIQEHGFETNLIDTTKAYVSKQFGHRSGNFKSVTLADGVQATILLDKAQGRNEYLEAVEEYQLSEAILKGGWKGNRPAIKDTAKPTQSYVCLSCIYFSKSNFTKETAKEWLKCRDYSSAIEDAGDAWYVEQEDKSNFSKFKYLCFAPGITGVVGIV